MGKKVKNDLDYNDFKLLARRYTEIEGAKLNNEAVSEKIRAYRQPKKPNVKKKIYVRYFAGIAAAVIIVFVISIVMNNFLLKKSSGNTLNDSSASSLPTNNDSTLWNAPEISLLGSRFEIVDKMEDNGQVVYTVEDFYHDNAAISVKSIEGFKTAVFDEMNYTYFDGQKIFYKFDYAYNIFIFTRGDSVFELTCKYRPSTLEELYNVMIIEA